MYVDTKETAFLHDLTKPSLEARSHVLRHKEMWPEGFEWGYRRCETCAMGLAYSLWEQIERPWSASMAYVLGMPSKVARNIFDGSDHWFVNYRGGSVPAEDWDAVTPDMVADQIDKYLASRKG